VNDKQDEIEDIFDIVDDHEVGSSGV